MNQHYFSAHPVYRNFQWPDSYLMQPLSAVPLYPTCQIAYIRSLQRSRNHPIKILDWLMLSCPDNTGLWDVDVLSIQLAMIALKQQLIQDISNISV